MTDNYRPDIYGQVEGRWRTDPPSQEIIDEALKIECPDCNVNVFIEEDENIDGKYLLVVAHDETCPWLKAKYDNDAQRDNP
jgi:hypothetical protein